MDVELTTVSTFDGMQGPAVYLHRGVRGIPDYRGLVESWGAARPGDAAAAAHMAAYGALH